MTEAWFEVAFGPHYPLIYAHRNEEEARQCLDLLPTLAPLAPHGLPILDLGCGDGRHLVDLRARGHQALGLDLSPALLSSASDRAANLPLIRGDMRHLPLLEQSMDSVLSLFTAFGYFGSLEDNAEVIAGIRRVLHPGGHWFFDYFNCDRVREELGHGRPVPRQRELGPFLVQETRQYDVGQQLVRKNVVLESMPGTSTAEAFPAPLQYTEQVAVFDLAEMDQLAHRYGLTRINQAGSYQGDELDRGDRWILVYQRQGE